MTFATCIFNPFIMELWPTVLVIDDFLKQSNPSVFKNDKTKPLYHSLSRKNSDADNNLCIMILHKVEHLNETSSDFNPFKYITLL